MQTNEDCRIRRATEPAIADLERRLAVEHTKRLIAERRAAELRRAVVLLRAEVLRLQARPSPGSRHNHDPAPKWG